MRPPASTYSFVTVVALLVLMAACTHPPAEIGAAPETGAEVSGTSDSFDPLGLQRDREVVPAKYPRTGTIVGRPATEETGSGQARDSLQAGGEEGAQKIDSANSQVYRVQIYTGLVHGEARQIARVAEEIFDQPVYVDYEVPNYKVRVGNWVNRDEAERYRQRAKTVGYGNAWVVMVSVNVREAELLYNHRVAPEQSVLEIHEDSVKVTDEDSGAED